MEKGLAVWPHAESEIFTKNKKSSIFANLGYNLPKMTNFAVIVYWYMEENSLVHESDSLAWCMNVTL